MLKVLHRSDVLNAVVSLVADWVPLVIHLNSFTSQIVHSLMLDFFPKENCKFVLILLNPSLHAGVPVIFDGVVSPALKEVGNISPLVCLVPVE